MIKKYMNCHFRKGLTKEGHTAMHKKHPKQNVKAPKLDQFVSEFAGKKLDRVRDAQLAKLQASVLYAVNPLTSLWADLIDKGLMQNPEGTILVAIVMDTIQRSLLLLGNANNLISETRRKLVLEAIHPSLKRYGKGDFSKAEENLFGEEFKETLVKKVEADSVLAKAVNIVTRSSKAHDNHCQRSQSKYGRKDRFLGAGAVGTGLCPARHTTRMLTETIKERKQTPCKSSLRKGGVFTRLGPQSQDKAHQRSVQDLSNY